MSCGCCGQPTVRCHPAREATAIQAMLDKVNSDEGAH